MRYSWIVLLILLLVSCGKPLKLTPNPAGSRAIQRTPQGPSSLPQSTADSASDNRSDVPLASSQPAITVTPQGQRPPEATPSVVIVLPTPEPQSNEQRWRMQQGKRQVFDPDRKYVASSPVTLLWYDPLTAQTLEIGKLLGEFTAQAEFTFRPRATVALEVLYHINQDYGLTAISPAVKQRMEAAGYKESVEAFVLQSDAIRRENS